MTDADPTIVRPREEVARALFDTTPFKDVGTYDEQTEVYRRMCVLLATAVLNRLHELGAFNDQFYDAIRAEDKRTK